MVAGMRHYSVGGRDSVPEYKGPDTDIEGRRREAIINGCWAGIPTIGISLIFQREWTAGWSPTYVEVTVFSFVRATRQ